MVLPAEQFKQFLSTPPVVQEMVYEKILARDLEKGFGDETTFPTNANRSFALAKWQPDFLYLKLSKINDVSGVALAAGQEIDAQMDAEHWRVDPIGSCAYWKDSTKRPEAIRMALSRLFRHRSDDFREVFSMGILHLEPGAIEWVGDSFKADGYVIEAKAPVRATGLLVRDHNGRAREMAVQYRIRQSTLRYCLRYSYSREGSGAVPSFLPTNIEGFLLRGTNEIKQVQFNILALKTRPTPLARTEFDPRPLLAASKVPVLEYKNGSWYETNALGEQVLAHGAFAPDRLRGYRENVDFKQLYHGAVLLSTVAAFSVSRRIRKNHKPKQKGMIHEK